MMILIDAYLIPIVIALLIGIAVAWWMFRGTRTTAVERDEPEAETPRTFSPPAERRAVHRPAPIHGAHEGRGFADHGATATTDVAGQILGVEARSHLPGASGPPDNLQLLKGVGPKLALRLNENGIIRFDQLAALSQNEVAILDEKMGPFRGRIARDRVVEQAAYLARDDRDGFEARFGKLGGGA